MKPKASLKNILGELPLTVELYWWLRAKDTGSFAFRFPSNVIVDSVAAARTARKTAPDKKIFIFATLHYWIEHTALLAIAMAGQGYCVTLAYLPYADWTNPISQFDLRRQDMYIRDTLRSTSKLINLVSLPHVKQVHSLPETVETEIRSISLFDSQYTLQAEEIDSLHPLYLLRMERNRAAACAALAYLQRHLPDIVIIPNGVILEFGAVYAISRFLDIPTVTYEYGEQSNRVWLAQNSQVIKHETDALWEARKNKPLTKDQREWLITFFAARQSDQRGEQFARLWQATGTMGGQVVRARLGLDDRPVVLFATNVLGDSLTLDRQLFSSNMSEWIKRLMEYFSVRHNVQLVIRIHPGENLTQGPSVTGIIYNILPELPENIHLIAPKENINTYDLMEIASLGLVYTTTSGLEMAARGIPVITAGKTHYRKRGFTIDADTYEEYFDKLDQVLANPSVYKPTQKQIELAWNYAYRFFYEFPRPFPWHILHVPEDIEKRPMHYVLGTGLAEYEATFRHLAGEPLNWMTLN